MLYNFLFRTQAQSRNIHAFEWYVCRSHYPIGARARSSCTRPVQKQCLIILAGRIHWRKKKAPQKNALISEIFYGCVQPIEKYMLKILSSQVKGQISSGGGKMLVRNMLSNFKFDTNNDSDLSLENGSRIAVVGGGPAMSLGRALIITSLNWRSCMALRLYRRR